ncbi:MAG: hypothetical protein MJZ19_07180 [Paludibacteraceae bacterium]|nr:hypothetical protein [Paludibacteraceae bacterium]
MKHIIKALLLTTATLFFSLQLSFGEELDTTVVSADKGKEPDFFKATTLYESKDSFMVEKWLLYLEQTPAQNDSLGYEYYRHFEVVCNDMHKNYSSKDSIYYRGIMDHLLDIAIKYPNKKMYVSGWTSHKYHHMIKPLIIYIYEELIRNYIADTPRFFLAYSVAAKEEIRNHVKYCEYNESFIQKYVDWLKEHRYNYELKEPSIYQQMGFTLNN